MIVVRYAIFAAVAMALNLLTQRGVLAYGEGPYSLLVAIGAGTAVGLIVKYVLDKNWIFYDRETGAGAHGRKLSLYVLAGLGTTALFWGSEALFWTFSQSDALREVGALIGLTAGYVVKFHLDRRFVFTRPGGV